MNNDDQKIIDLYQQTRLKQPSASLDDKILLAAKNKVVQSKNKPKKLIWALSSAAVIVLSVNVALKIVVEPTSFEPSPSPIIKEEVMDSMQAAPDTSMSQFDKTLSLEEKKAVKNLSKKKMAPKNSAAQSGLSQESALLRSVPQAARKMEVQTLSDKPEKPLPYFPFNLKRLKALYPSLNIKQQGNNIHLFHLNQLILSLKRLNNGLIEINAYPQENELNLTIDWNAKPNCDVLKSNHCELNSQQTGVFEKNRLIKVVWTQKIAPAEDNYE